MSYDPADFNFVSPMTWQAARKRVEALWGKRAGVAEAPRAPHTRCRVMLGGEIIGAAPTWELALHRAESAVAARKAAESKVVVPKLSRTI